MTSLKMAFHSATGRRIVEVYNDHGKMVGVITVDDLLEELLPQGWRREFGMHAVEE